MTNTDAVPNQPLTQAVRRMLDIGGDRSEIDDFLFLERWEHTPMHGAATALRISQIRRANPVLAAAVRAELAARS
jgi:hypothetical protein